MFHEKIKIAIGCEARLIEAPLLGGFLLGQDDAACAGICQ